MGAEHLAVEGVGDGLNLLTDYRQSSDDDLLMLRRKTLGLCVGLRCDEHGTP